MLRSPCITYDLYLSRIFNPQGSGLGTNYMRVSLIMCLSQAPSPSSARTSALICLSFMSLLQTPLLPATGSVGMAHGLGHWSPGSPGSLSGGSWYGRSILPVLGLLPPCGDPSAPCCPGLPAAPALRCLQSAASFMEKSTSTRSTECPVPAQPSPSRPPLSLSAPSRRKLSSLPSSPDRSSRCSEADLSAPWTDLSSFLCLL